MRKHFVVWTRDNCAFCVRAKQLITVKGYSYEEKKVGDGGYSLNEMYEAAPNARTFPQITTNGELIGGYTDLVEYFSETE